MTEDLFYQVRELTQKLIKETTLDEAKSWALEHGIINRNSKLLKGDNFNVGVELLPSDLSGKNLCAGAGACKFSCIAFSGKGNLLRYKSILSGKLTPPLMSKLMRTKLLNEDPEFFYDQLHYELLGCMRIAMIKGVKLAVRLNTTSDVDFSGFIASHPDIQFYDYTKIWNRIGGPNHHITYSASEKTSEKAIQKAISQGKTVAVIFKKVPTEWKGIPVVSGDESDDRYNDISGSILGLKYKFTMGKNVVADFVK